MNIGIFGDSYCDKKGNKIVGSWAEVVNKHVKPNSVGYYGSSGTSQWWSYQEFLKHYHKYDTIFFVHSSIRRWPHLPEDLMGHHYDVGYNISDSELIKEMNKYFLHIFSDELLSFIGESIFKAVNDTCRKNDIYLVNLVPFEVFYDLTTDYPVITDIDEVSRSEEIVFNGKNQNFFKVLTDNKINDPRSCHLNNSNNQLLGNHIIDLLENKTYNNKTSMLTEMNWVKTDDNLMERFQGVMK